MLIVSCIVSTYFKWTLWFLRFVCFGRGSWADAYHVDETASDIKEISRLEQRRKSKPLVDYFSEGIDRALGIAAAYRSGDYSQKEIADYCGIHYSTVSRSLRDQGMKK